MSLTLASRDRRSLILIVLFIIVAIAVIVGRRIASDRSTAATTTSASPGKGKSDPSPLRADADPTAIALLPKNFAYAVPGALTIATHPGALPLGDYANDGKRLIGVEPDIAGLIADALGLRLNLVAVAWADWPLGLESGKYDAVISNVTVTEERKKKFDFSSYRYDLLGIYTRADGPIQQIREPKDVAGLKVVIGASTNQDQILRRWDAQNVANGLQPVQFQYFEDEVLGRMAVISGRADVSFQPNAIGAYNARDGQVRRVGLFPGGWPESAAISVATRRDSGLAAAITQALNSQIDNGNYAKALARWDLSDEAVPHSQTNPPGLAAQ